MVVVAAAAAACWANGGGGRGAGRVEEGFEVVDAAWLLCAVVAAAATCGVDDADQVGRGEGQDFHLPLAGVEPDGGGVCGFVGGVGGV